MATKGSALKKFVTKVWWKSCKLSGFNWSWKDGTIDVDIEMWERNCSQPMISVLNRYNPYSPVLVQIDSKKPQLFQIPLCV